MPDNKLWLIHEESGSIFQGSAKDIPGDGCVEELGLLVTGLRAELERLLFARGWSAKRIVAETAGVNCTDDPPPVMLYMAGTEDRKMFAGPSPSQDDILSDCPPAEFDKQPIFVFDANENKTHRWHWGRGEWVKINQK